MKCREHLKCMKFAEVDSHPTVYLHCEPVAKDEDDKPMPTGFGFWRERCDYSYVIPLTPEIRAQLHTLLKRPHYECEY